MEFARHMAPAFLLLATTLLSEVCAQNWNSPVPELGNRSTVVLGEPNRVIGDQQVSGASLAPQGIVESASDCQCPAIGPLEEEERCFRSPNERHWTVFADAIFLQQSRPGDSVLIADNLTSQATTLLNAKDFRFGMEGGFRVGMRMDNVLDSGWGLECLYYGVDDWESTFRGYSSEGAAIRFIRPMFECTTLPVSIAGDYASELENVEVNVRFPLGKRLNFLAGVRYTEVKEGLSLALSFNSDQDLRSLGVKATNRLIGFQIGADGLFWNRGRLGLGYLLKAGIFSNAAKNRAVPTTIASTPMPCWGIIPLQSSASTTHTAFVGEIGLTGVYQLNRGWAIRGGYQLLWIEGVALASDQLAVSDPWFDTATVDTGGSPFYHGAFVGLEFTR